MAHIDPSDKANLSLAVAAVALLLVTLAAYQPVLSNGFVNYDDPEYVTENPRVQGGLTWKGMSWAFTNRDAANWFPLTWISHMLDCQLYGLDPKGHHLTNLLFHLFNSALLLLVLERITGRLWLSALVASFFALHPLHVESVAWVAERKDVLSSFFWLLTMLAYHGWTRRPSRRRYALLALALTLGLMAKPMLVTVPFVLLLLDYWPLGRFGGDATRRESPGHRAWKLVQEKLPLFFLVGVFSLVTLWAQRGGGAVVPVEALPIGYRIPNALVSTIRYVMQMFWPVNLAAFYPHPLDKLPSWQFLGSALLLIAVTLAVLHRRRSKPYLLVGWFWYLGTLVPVIGLVQVGEQARADRYTYLPLIGLFIMIAWGMSDLLAGRLRRQEVWAVPAALIILALALGTRSQVSVWQSGITLFEHATRVVPDNYLAFNNLGAAYANAGRCEDAIKMCKEATRLRPNYAKAHYIVGKCYDLLEKDAEAIDAYKEALRSDPDFVKAHNDLAMVYGELGQYQEAIGAWKEVIRLDPDGYIAYYNLGRAYAVLGRQEDAVVAFQQAIRRGPDFADAHNDLGKACAALGRYQEAITAWEEAARLKPEDGRLHYNLGKAYGRTKRTEEAIQAYQKAIRYDPNFAMARNDLGLVYAELGRYPEAVSAWKEAIQIDPDLPQPHYNLALAYMQMGNWKLALKEYDYLRTSHTELAFRLYEQIRSRLVPLN